MYNASSYGGYTPPRSIAASTIKPIPVKSKVIVLNHNNVDTIDEHFQDDDNDDQSIGSNSIGNKSISSNISHTNTLHSSNSNNTFHKVRANGMVVKTGIKTIVAQNKGSLATPRVTKDLKFSQRRDCDDFFENRFQKDTGKYYYFNPYTGETILDIEGGYLDRSKSYWAPPDVFPSEKAKTTIMYPVWYACRNGGPYRKRKGPFIFNSIDEAAYKITSVAVGWITRQNLRRIINQRFYKFFDISSKYFYFVDNKTKSTSWYKPRLAYPTDILKKEDMRDAGDNFRNYSKGPVIARVGLGKMKLKPYRKPNSGHDDDVPPPPEPEMIDLDVPEHRLVSTWFDSNLPKFIDYRLLYQLMLKNDWDTILDQYKKACAINHKLIKMFCLYSFQRMALEIENEKGFMSNTCVEVMELMIQKFEQEGHSLKYGCNEMQFAALTLQAMLSQHAGRREFYSTASIDDDDDDLMEKGIEGRVRSAKMEEYLQKKMDVIIKFLRHIPVELLRDKKTLEDYEAPTARAVDFAAVIINCLAYLAHEPLERDLLAVHCAKYVFNAIKICIHESAVVSVGFRCCYNFCYMCKEGQEALLDLQDEYGATIEDFISAAKMNELHGDYEVQREARRLELSLAPEGWRGKVEETITREILEKREGYDLTLKKLE